MYPSIPLPDFKVADGPYLPNWDSIASMYSCPDWFRDAKFGMWCHWSPQCVPEFGDWYARNMYMEGSKDYQYHVETYGHPSQFGYKDLCRLWTLEKWDPQSLMKRFKRAGAKYFSAMANHHCNYDIWDSKYQPWNSRNVGPRRDVVGEWARAARDEQLRFGVTFHNTPGRTWRQFMPHRYTSDKSGPYKGVPYDALLTQADGAGTWWEGLDPQDLYGPAHEANTPCPEFTKQFLLRVDDLLRQYKPDLLYFDDSIGHVIDLDVLRGMPDTAPLIAAHYYNLSLQWHGEQRAVLNLKDLKAPGWKDGRSATVTLPDYLLGAVVHDFERHRNTEIAALPWQTETCVGEWHYKRGMRYRPMTEIVHELIEVVCNNGCYMLNFSGRADGTLDEREHQYLDDITNWMDVNGEAIYATRPWTRAADGSTRFVTKGQTLYALLLEWPAGGDVVIPSLGAGVDATRIKQITLLGHTPALEYRHEPQALVVRLPERKPCEHAWSLRITTNGV